MAYDKKNLLHIGGVSPLPQTYEYFSADTVTTAGYFPKESGIQDGDHVTLVKITRSGTPALISAYTRTEYYMKADASGVLTATAVA